MTAYARMIELFREQHAIDSAIGLMGWDRQVLMPSGGGEARTAQSQILTRMLHGMRTSDETRRAIEDARAEVEPGSVEAAQVRVFSEEVERATKLPTELVVRKSKISNESYDTWRRAKPAGDFASMEPYYRELFGIAQETAAALGYKDHIYDALIDLFEPKTTYESARSMFDTVKQPIIDLVRDIRTNGRKVEDSFLTRDWDQEALRSFAQEAATQIGFDFGRGRLDIAANAFCSGSTSGDVRMTTRASEHLKGIVSSSFHEMGHGLYEQGVNPTYDGTPIGGGASMAIHESQSRLWENIIGRSLGFWRLFRPALVRRFPDLEPVSAEGLYHAVSNVLPTFIRVGADELTYNLHILVRFEIEVELVTGRLEVKDLPEAWNQRYTDYMGITPPNDGLGVLQDVHWARGSVGYFPTYSMGNMVGAQIWATLQDEIGDQEANFAAGNFKPVLGWLQERIYQHGQRFTAQELVQNVTGKPMSSDAWLAYAGRKYRDIYGLA